MPKGDGTGPEGNGPRTGRGSGGCGKGKPKKFCKQGNGNRRQQGKCRQTTT